MRLHHRVAIVTGAASGIGRAIARRFADEGARVVLGDIDRAGGEAAAEGIRQAARPGGGTARFVPCDVGDRASAQALVAAVVEHYGRLDILVNNAGVVHGADFLELEEADFDRVLRINLKGPFLLGQAAARQMIAQARPEQAEGDSTRPAGPAGPIGTIINITSINAVLAIPHQVPYVASKGGLQQLTKVMAVALADKGIRVNAIGPGSILTDMLRDAVMADDSARRRILSRTPLGRLGEVDEIAAIAVFLASDESSYVTGQTIYADGGRLALNLTVPVPE
ncbi:MAG TPA: SDR family oxidoreductase [Polyangia bacterium]|jgi:NAD(P)-dependent dehydrogenase (short-subunit alcohol dehydrogenase family)|nr:SDR family oxidoreductase [Polyangia bacterium]